MIDHVSIGVRDIAKSKRFYDAALKPLGYQCLSATDSSLGYGRDAVALWISAAERPVPADMKSGLHFCFTAPTRSSVDRFHAAALTCAATTTANPVCAPIMDQATTPPSPSTPTATVSRRIAAMSLDRSPLAARRHRLKRTGLPPIDNPGLLTILDGGATAAMRKRRLGECRHRARAIDSRGRLRGGAWIALFSLL
jgi:hypothetical protein